MQNNACRRLLSDLSLLDEVKNSFGHDLKLWRTNCFKKVSGSGEVKWHHDRHFENGNSPIEFANLKNHFSILLAITDIDEKSGVIEFIPGSHLPSKSYKQDIRPYHRRKSDEHFLSIPEYLAEKRISVPLKRGEFMLFHSGLLHRSLPANGKDVNRYSMVARLCTSNTIIPLELAPETAICEFPFQ